MDLKWELQELREAKKIFLKYMKGKGLNIYTDSSATLELAIVGKIKELTEDIYPKTLEMLKYYCPNFIIPKGLTKFKEDLDTMGLLEE